MAAPKPSKLVPLSKDEELGNIPTHFMKSGSSLRPKKDLTDLQKFKRRLLPSQIEGLDVEYDVWFNTNELHTVRKWLYTDFLGKGIYMRVNSIKINNKLFRSIASSDIKIDEERIEKIKNNLQNKYALGINQEYYDNVIFTPGSNLLCKDKVVHFGRMKALVNKGYIIKPHPITAPIYMAILRKHFGKENVLHKKAGGLELLLNCKNVGTMQNSEMGLIALLLGKGLSLISYTMEEREKNLLTYESFYYACAGIGQKAMYKLLSAKNSGIIFDFDKDADERLENYVNNFWEYKKADD